MTVISSKAERKSEVEALGAIPAIGSIQDAEFLAETFKGADIVYLMETWESLGNIFDKNIDFLTGFETIAENYKKAVLESGVNRIIHLSSVGAHTDKGTGSLQVHHNVENILKTLPETITIKFMRPVGFFSNLYRSLPTIKSKGAIIQSYGGDQKEPWVSPLDIAASIAYEMERPFNGRTVHYLASEEVSPNEIAECIGRAIGNPILTWDVITGDKLLDQLLSAGANEWVANGIVDMQKAQQNGTLYDDFYHHKPTFGKIKLEDFAKEFAEKYREQNS